MKKITFALIALLAGLSGRAQFNQDFEAGLGAWTTINSGDDSTWTLLDLEATAFLAHSGTNVVSLDATVNAQSDYLISPAITVTADLNDYLYFWARNRGISATADIDVLVSTTGTNLVDFNTTLETEVNPPAGLNFFRYGVDLSAYVGQTIYVALHASADVAVTVDIDDIINTALPTCEPPSGFIASDVTANAAVLSWLDAGLDNNVQIEYGPSGFALGTGTVVNLTDTLLYSLGLTANVDLDVYIRTDCGDGNFSDWVQIDLNANVDLDNDECEDAIAVNVGVDFQSGSILSTSIGASTSSQENPSCATLIANDVWFTTVVPASGSLVVQTGLALGSLNLDTVIAVFTGTCGNLTQVACNDNVNLLNLFSSVSVSGLTPGETVYVAVYQNGLLGVLNGSFLLSVYNGSLAADDFNAEKLTYFPNPVTSVLNLRNPENIRSVKIYNELGQTVEEVGVDNTTSEISMSSLARGLYFVDVTTETGIERLKIMKQ
ncbi:MAG: T9SS type A sorting domain-containing protein [Flavobacterium sp.]|uniref:T9SS-dependent choice-of-anchor J family protein n=1 Tax=Flavobacterium sp. TaxID=239 RepID=UPI00120E90A3|nr:choice-of-anchor J domain-containing protein [Flavobacterium sp.]RZJ67057.1 MAG: T9SS type A sorting domain-containing protein [Flavobacterium sp.]